MQCPPSQCFFCAQQHLSLQPFSQHALFAGHLQSLSAQQSVPAAFATPIAPSNIVMPIKLVKKVVRNMVVTLFMRSAL